MLFSSASGGDVTETKGNPTERTPGARVDTFLLARSPLGQLVRWVAGIRAPVRAKLLCAFLLIALLIIAVGGISLEILGAMARHSRSLDEAHERVHAWVVVANHPFYVITNERGEFTLDNVPGGTYTLEVWQESLGSARHDVSVSDQGITTLTVEIGQK